VSQVEAQSEALAGGLAPLDSVLNVARAPDLLIQHCQSWPSSSSSNTSNIRHLSGLIHHFHGRTPLTMARPDRMLLPSNGSHFRRIISLRMALRAWQTSSSPTKSLVRPTMAVSQMVTILILHTLPTTSMVAQPLLATIQIILTRVKRVKRALHTAPISRIARIIGTRHLR